MKETPYDRRYADAKFYWGKGPSSPAPRVPEMIKPSAVFYCLEETFDCDSGGVSHKRYTDRFIARRYVGDRE